MYEETRETRMQRLHNKQGRKKNESHALYRQTDRQLDKRIARIRFGWRHDAAAGVPRTPDGDRPSRPETTNRGGPATICGLG